MPQPAANSLRTPLRSPFAGTKVHVTRLEDVFKIIGKKPEQKTCDAMMGIIKEGAEIMDEYQGTPALDAGLLAAAQADRTLRDVALWHPAHMGTRVGNEGCRQAAADDARRGTGD